MATMTDTKIESLANTLRKELSHGATVITSKSEEYLESIVRWSSAAEKRAAIIVFPVCAEDVSNVIKLATSNRIEIAVCGGGHSTSGSSSTEGGICIDMSKLRKVSVDPKAKIVVAEGGALWADVDKAAAEHELAVVGGTVNTTGVGGLTLGGGYGYLVGEHGLVIDNLLEVQMVLADGSIVIASRHREPKLFWAVRGAGASFGVVLSFTFRAHEMNRPVWGGTLAIDAGEIDKVVEFANLFLEKSDPKSALIWGFKALSSNTFCIVAAVFYNGPEPLATDLFGGLIGLKLLENFTGNRLYWTMNTLLNEDLKAGPRRSMKGSAFISPLDLKFAKTCFEDFRNLIQKIPDASMSIMVFEFLPFWKLFSFSQDYTAFANRGAYGNLLWIMGWTKAEHDKEIRQWTQDMSSKSHQEFEKSRMKARIGGVIADGVGEYFNYDSIGVGGTQVFGDNFAQLQQLKKKYDPNNVFSKGPQLVFPNTGA